MKRLLAVIAVLTVGAVAVSVVAIDGDGDKEITASEKQQRAEETARDVASQGRNVRDVDCDEQGSSSYRCKLRLESGKCRETVIAIKDDVIEGAYFERRHEPC